MTENWGGYSDEDWAKPSSILFAVGTEGDDVAVLERHGVHAEYASREMGALIFELERVKGEGLFITTDFQMVDASGMTDYGYEHDIDFDFTYRRAAKDEVMRYLEGKALFKKRDTGEGE